MLFSKDFESNFSTRHNWWIRGLLLLATTLSVPVLAVPQYGSCGFAVGPINLRVVNFSTWESEIVGPLDPKPSRYSESSSLSVNPVDGSVYITNSHSPAGISSVDRATGAATLIVPGIFRALAFDDSGVMYSVDGGENLLRITLPSGHIETLSRDLSGAAGSGELSNLAFNRGYLYAVRESGTEILRFKLTTGSIKRIPLTCSGCAAIKALFFGKDNSLLLLDEDRQLFSVDYGDTNEATKRLTFYRDDPVPFVPRGMDVMASGEVFPPVKVRGCKSGPPIQLSDLLWKIAPLEDDPELTVIADHLHTELQEEFDLHLPVSVGAFEASGSAPANLIVLARWDHPVVRTFAEARGIEFDSRINDEGYLIETLDDPAIIIIGDTDTGLFRGVQSLLRRLPLQNAPYQLLYGDVPENPTKVFIDPVSIVDWPDKPIRGVHYNQGGWCVDDNPENYHPEAELNEYTQCAVEYEHPTLGDIYGDEDTVSMYDLGELMRRWKMNLVSAIRERDSPVDKFFNFAEDNYIDPAVKLGGIGDGGRQSRNRDIGEGVQVRDSFKFRQDPHAASETYTLQPDHEVDRTSLLPNANFDSDVAPDSGWVFRYGAWSHVTDERPDDDDENAVVSCVVDISDGDPGNDSCGMWRIAGNDLQLESSDFGETFTFSFHARKDASSSFEPDVRILLTVTKDDSGMSKSKTTEVSIVIDASHSAWNEYSADIELDHSGITGTITAVSLKIWVVADNSASGTFWLDDFKICHQSDSTCDDITSRLTNANFENSPAAVPSSNWYIEQGNWSRTTDTRPPDATENSVWKCTDAGDDECRLLMANSLSIPPEDYGKTYTVSFWAKAVDASASSHRVSVKQTMPSDSSDPYGNCIHWNSGDAGCRDTYGTNWRQTTAYIEEEHWRQYFINVLLSDGRSASDERTTKLEIVIVATTGELWIDGFEVRRMDGALVNVLCTQTTDECGTTSTVSDACGIDIITITSNPTITISDGSTDFVEGVDYEIPVLPAWGFYTETNPDGNEVCHRYYPLNAPLRVELISGGGIEPQTDTDPGTPLTVSYDMGLWVGTDTRGTYSPLDPKTYKEQETYVNEELDYHHHEDMERPYRYVPHP